MKNCSIEEGYLAISTHERIMRIPLRFIKVLTPVYNEATTLRDKQGEYSYTFDIWIYPSFAQSHGVAMRCIEQTGQLYSVLPPTPDINLAHEMHDKLSAMYGFSEDL